MPFNGSGTYIATALPGSWNPATTGSSATPTDWNTLLTDISTALSTCITKDGQTTVSADIPMATHKITGLGNATADTDALNRQGALYVYNQQTVVSQSAIDITNIPSTVSNLKLVFDLTPEANSIEYGVQFYNSSNVLDTTNYSCMIVAAKSSAATVAATLGTTAYITIGSLVQQSVLAVSGFLEIPHIQGAVTNIAATGMSQFQNTTAGGPLIGQSIFGRRTVADPITGIRVLCSGGTFSGTITLYASK